MSGRFGMYASQGGVTPFAFGNALLFSTGDYVSFGGANILAATGSAWSAGGWFNLSSFPTGFPIIMKLKSGVVNNPFSLFFSNNVSYVDFSFGSNSSHYRGKVVVASLLGNYQHIVVTYNGAGATTSSNYKVYVNAINSAISASGGFASATDTSYLGDITGANPFAGKEDDVCFYQSELTSTQVSNWYNGGAGASPDADVTPLVWFKLNESGTDTTAINSGSGGATYDGTLNNFPTSGMWVPH